MESKYFFKFKSYSDKQQVMFYLIKLLSEHSQNGSMNLERLYAIFSAIYREELVLFNKNVPQENQIHWYNFDELLKMPPKDWFRANEEEEEFKNWISTVQKRILKKGIYLEDDNAIEEKDTLNYIYLRMLDQPIIHLPILNLCNKIVLSPGAEKFLETYKLKGYDQQNVEQSVMADIIRILRKIQDPLAYEIYKIIRSWVAAKNMKVDLKTKRVAPNILSENEFLKLRNIIEELTLKIGGEDINKIVNLLEDLYSTAVGPLDIKYCQACGNPVWGDECVGGILCETKLEKGGSKFGIYPVETGEKVYFLKDGVIRYNSIPGIDELWLSRYLEDRYKKYDFVKVVIYPGKDAEGDIAVEIGYEKEDRIVIDLKGWRKSWMLEEKISQEAASFRNKDFLFVPMNLKRFYSNGVDGLNRTLKRNNLKTIAVSDRQLFSRIDDRIKLYLQNNKIEGEK